MQLLGPEVIIPKLVPDHRGFFLQSFHQEMDFDLAQVNHSYSKKNVLRGMHYQPGQEKIIQVISGKIYDVVVDVRENSSTYMQWEGIYLDENEKKQFYVPEGFAHGFYVLSDESYLIFMVNKGYDVTDTGFRYDDPSINIHWPFQEMPILSERDKNAPFVTPVPGI